MRLLVAESSPTASARLRALLQRRFFAVDVEHDGDAGLDRLLSHMYDIAVVEAALPRRDGFSIVRTAREHGVTTLTVMLTARNGAEERVRALLGGADDCIVKPFADDELVARLNALSRRAIGRCRTIVVEAGPLHIDVSAHRATYAGTVLDLSATEFRLLTFLVRNAGATMSRGQLLAHVWTRAFDGPTNVVDVCIGGVRRELARAGGANVIETVRGLGYRVAPRTPLFAIS